MASRKNKSSQKQSFMERASFQNFIVGRSNQAAWAAAKYASNQPGKYSSLFIYGGEGLGKTHLLFAMKSDSLAHFWTKYGGLDALLMDDIDFFVGKEYAQQGFLRIFNRLYEANKQIVFTSAKYPKELDGLEQKLCNHFETGLTVDIQPPDMATKTAILESKASLESISPPNNVILYIISVCGSDGNVREMEGCLARIIAVSSITGKKITLPFAKDVLRPLMPKKKVDRMRG